MGESTSRAKVSVALVGVGPTWEQHYHAAVQHLSSKLSVRAVCDSVLNRAIAVAEELKATPVSCPWNLTQRTDLHAWLILDPGWFETYPAALAVRLGRSALFANTFAFSLGKLIPILEQSLEQSESLMPEFPERFSPTTTRLRELMATRVGRVRRIEITVPLGESPTIPCWLRDNASTAVQLIDWCTCLTSTSVKDVSVLAWDTIELLFAQRATSSQEPSKATVRFIPGGFMTRRVECERGWVLIEDETRISWQSPEANGCEAMTHERSPFEIILDQFCRRALGGLLPVPTVKDALHAVTTYHRVASACLVEASD